MGAELVVLVDVVVTGGSSTTSGLGPPHVAVHAPVVKLVKETWNKEIKGADGKPLIPMSN